LALVLNFIVASITAAEDCNLILF